jgi:hypothetical protein
MKTCKAVKEAGRKGIDSDGPGPLKPRHEIDVRRVVDPIIQPIKQSADEEFVYL